jgi:hypothetical protein
MAVTQLTDVIIPDEFTAYQVENSLVSTALARVAWSQTMPLSPRSYRRALRASLLLSGRLGPHRSDKPTNPWASTHILCRGGSRRSGISPRGVRADQAAVDSAPGSIAI